MRSKRGLEALVVKLVLLGRRASLALLVLWGRRVCEARLDLEEIEEHLGKLVCRDIKAFVGM